MMKLFNLPQGSRPNRGRLILGLTVALLCACDASGQRPADKQLAKDDVVQAANAPAATPPGAEAPYTVECGSDGACLVDKKTFVGWRTFHAFCHVCHGPDALGSTFAPSLINRLQEIDKERFLFVVENGFTGKTPSGEPGVMPPWKENPNVNKKYEELYAYLKARSDGALRAGRPKKFPKKTSE